MDNLNLPVRLNEQSLSIKSLAMQYVSPFSYRIATFVAADPNRFIATCEQYLHTVNKIYVLNVSGKIISESVFISGFVECMENMHNQQRV
jgi:hypothetical protein